MHEILFHDMIDMPEIAIPTAAKEHYTGSLTGKHDPENWSGPIRLHVVTSRAADTSSTMKL